VVPVLSVHVTLPIEEADVLYRSIAWVSSSACGARVPPALAQVKIAAAGQLGVFCLRGGRL